MDPKFEALRQAIASDVADQVARLGQQLRKDLSGDIAKQLETAGEHLAGRMQVHAEELKDQMQKAAEGYGGTLDGIQRDLKEFRAEWRKKADDTDLILANHNSRITVLEQSAKG
jgi:cytochrome c556